MVTKKKETAPAVVEPDTKKLSSETNSIANQARSITVQDAASYQKASALIDTGNEILKEIGVTFDPLIANAHQLHKDLIAKKKVFTGPIEAALSAKKREMASWQMEQERLRRAEEARLTAEAKKHSDALAIAEAEALRKTGDVEAAKEVIQQAIEAPAQTVVLPKFQSTEFGRGTRTIWRWEIIDLTKIPLSFLAVCNNASTGLMQDVSTAAIAAIVKGTKNKEMTESMFGGGVKVWADTIVI